MDKKSWLFYIALFISLFLFALSALMGKEADVQYKKTATSISRTETSGIPNNSDFSIQKKVNLTGFSDCLLEKEISVNPRIRTGRLSVLWPSLLFHKRLLNVNTDISFYICLKESFTSNYKPYVDMLFSRKYYIYGQNKLLI